MPVTIHCVRHGQGLHNVGAGNYTLPDPKLTPLGEEQCLTVRKEHFSDQSHISMITASALSRTIHSAHLIFQPAIESKTSPKTILALPDAQETSDDPCDIGSDPQVLRETCEKNHWPADLSLIKDGWNDKRVGGRYSPSSKAIERRARDLRIFFRKQARELIAAGDQDVQIALVTHGGFLHFFSEDWEYADKYPATGWVNCETRAYTFENGIDNDDDTDAHLIETVDSRRKRGLEDPIISKERQIELFTQAMQKWEDQGLQNPLKVGCEEGIDV